MISTLHDLSARGPVRVARHALVRAVPVPHWRYAALVALVAGFAHDLVHGRIGAPALAAQLDDQASALVPPASGFVAWSVIQVVMIGYGLAQLGEGQRRVAAYDRVSRIIVLIAALSSLRLSMLMQGELWITAAVSVSIAVAAAVAYLRVHREIVAERASAWVGVPFSLLLGWTTMLAISALDATITRAGCPSPAPAVMLLAVAAVGVIYLGLHLRDFVLPALVAWLVTAICATNLLPPMVGTGALLAGALCAIVAIVIAATRFSPTRPVASPSPSQRSRRA